MFTGLVEHVGTIESLEHSESSSPRSENGACLGSTGARIRVNAGPLAAGLAKSGSIAVNGCCLTAVEISAEIFAADLSGETLRRTAFGEEKTGQPVNLERPLAATARLGGHFVQGHVDGIGRVTRLTPEGDNWWLSVRVPQDLRRYVAEKGSIAIDGISLTVARWHPQDGIAEVATIPFTHQHTNVHAMTVNDAVNIEVDILAKYVESLIAARKTPATSRLTVTELIEEGF